MFYYIILAEFKEGQNKFAEFAAQGSQCSVVHANYVKENGGQIFWLNELKVFFPSFLFLFFYINNTW